MILVRSYEELSDRGEVKIVLNNEMESLYFSRMVIPSLKGVDEKDWHKHYHYYRHVGMYAYRKDVLEKITKLPRFIFRAGRITRTTPLDRERLQDQSSHYPALRVIVLISLMMSKRF
jgi:hypothetical protein